MITELFKNWIVLKNKSFMIGDQITDKKAAQRSNLYFEYVENDIYEQVKRICTNLKI